MIGKKAVELWISYVMLVLFMVVLGMLVFNWARQEAVQSTAGFKTVYDSEKCNAISISIDVVENPDTLEILVRNTNNLRVNMIIFREHYPDGIYISEKNVTVKPDKSKTFSIDKPVIEGVTLQGITLLEAVPVYVDYETGSSVICSSRKGVHLFES